MYGGSLNTSAKRRKADRIEARLAGGGGGAQVFGSVPTPTGACSLGLANLSSAICTCGVVCQEAISLVKIWKALLDSSLTEW
jgi:hypothetical protein